VSASTSRQHLGSLGVSGWRSHLDREADHGLVGKRTMFGLLASTVSAATMRVRNTGATFHWCSSSVRTVTVGAVPRWMEAHAVADVEAQHLVVCTSLLQVPRARHDPYIRSYNEKRIKLSLGFRSPVEHRRSRPGRLTSPRNRPHPHWLSFRSAPTTAPPCRRSRPPERSPALEPVSGSDEPHRLPGRS